MTDKRPPLVGEGWAERLLSTGRVAASGVRLAARQVFGREGPVDGLIGESLAAEMDRMKGMAMKVGQILSYFDGILPEETHEALRVLQQGVTSMPYERVADVLREAFGEPVEELFEDFEREPVAGASIGQVHRARYRGRSVAVKVQYPGIVRTLESDFRRLRGLTRLASAGTPVDSMAIVTEMQERVIAECDYLAEARAQEAFRAAFAADEEVRIPPVVEERTRRTALTTDWAEGKTFYDFAKNATRPERDAAGVILLRFAYRSFFELQTVNADPHPGNYFFPEPGRVVFIDFGCVRQFSPSFVERERRLATTLIENRREDFREVAMATGMIADERGFDFDLYWRMLRHQYAPYTTAGFEFTTDYVRDALEFGKPSRASNKTLRRLSIQPEWIWFQRLQWGLHAVLARLGVRGDFGELLRDFLAAEPRRLTLS
jgi:predicted unusual protein kinase regulating ubiquinone biosynthesis (AarF/ABC1/UbiB family)